MAPPNTPSTPTLPKELKIKQDPGSAPGSKLPGASGSSVSLGYCYTLSSRTCLAILDKLDETQLDYEIKHIRTFDPSFVSKAKNKQSKLNLIRNLLNNSLKLECNNILDSYNALLNSVSCAAERAETLVERLDDVSTRVTATPPQQLISEEPTDDTRHLPVTRDPAETPFTGNLDNPVSLCDIKVGDVSANDISAFIDFNRPHPGGRRTAYFGNKPYGYGRVKHEPAPYPEHQTLDKIFDALASINPDITREHYSCLATLYSDGGSSIPLHQDNEATIDPDSNIYCVSFGAKRVLKVSNTIGPLVEHEVPLEHGSVYYMSRTSQDNWRHGIDRDANVTIPRVSLTFRKLNDPNQPTERVVVPPVAPPSSHHAPASHSRTSRVLFVHDSMHSTCPEKIFEQVHGHTCVKRVNYQLADVFGFEPEFKYAKTVLISCGINDLARYGKTARSLADVVCNRLAKCCRDNHGTNFIFNSITLTKNNDWLNKEIEQFNDFMYDLSVSIPNLTFFDSHALIRNYSKYDGGPVWSRSDRNGIKFDVSVLKMVTRELVNSVGYLAGSHDPRFRSCRWLYNTAGCSSSHRSG